MNKRVSFPNFAQLRLDISALIDELPNASGVTAVNFFKQRFREGGWKDKTFEKWEDKADGSASNLIENGHLRRSIRKKTTKRMLITSADRKYAALHNDGGTIQETVTVKEHTRQAHTRAGKRIKAHKVRTHTRTMNTTYPKRQFMGHSDYLMKKIEKEFMDAVEQLQKNNL